MIIILPGLLFNWSLQFVGRERSTPLQSSACREYDGRRQSPSLISVGRTANARRRFSRVITRNYGNVSRLRTLIAGRSIIWSTGSLATTIRFDYSYSARRIFWYSYSYSYSVEKLYSAHLYSSSLESVANRSQADAFYTYFQS